jgi:peroxiredoxin
LVSLQQELDALTAKITASKRIPQQIAPQFMAGIKEQIASGKSEMALKAGDAAPAFKLRDQNGACVSLSLLRARGPLVISFYRGAWCSYCNLELQALEAARADIEARGASIIAISMQNAAFSSKSVSENHLGFPSLIDADGQVAADFGLLYSLSAQTIELYKALGLDLELINAQAGWSLLMPARYLIAREGIVAYAEVNPDYTHRAEPGDLLPILDKLPRSKSATGRFSPTQP